MSFSDAHGNAVLDATQSFELSLHSGAPGGDGTANEIVGGNYSRRPVTTNAASGKATANSNSDTFDSLAAVTVTHAVLWEGVVAKYITQLATPQDVGAGESLQFSPGDITITLT